MTDTTLLEPYLSDEEIDEMREEGKDVYARQNVEEAYKVAEKYTTCFQPDLAEGMVNVANGIIDFYKEAVYDLTGLSIEYNETAQRWYNTENGQFVRDPYVETHLDQNEWEIQLFEKYM